MPAPVIAHVLDYLALIPIVGMFVVVAVRRLLERRREASPPDDERRPS